MPKCIWWKITLTGSGRQSIQENRELNLFSLETKQLWEESNCCLQPSKGLLERAQSETPLGDAQKYEAIDTDELREF